MTLELSVLESPPLIVILGLLGAVMSGTIRVIESEKLEAEKALEELKKAMHQLSKLSSQFLRKKKKT